MDRILVQEADFDPGAEMAALTAGDAAAGAVASFVGLVRGDAEGVSAMPLEHCPGMTEKSLADIVAAARDRWQLNRVTVIHRVGRLLPGDRIVLVAVSSSHRGEAFAAARDLIDTLKSSVPIWKHQTYADGTDSWVGLP